MAKLTEKQKKKIIAESVNGARMDALAKKYGVSATTIFRVVHGDPKTKEKVRKKRAENTESILAFMEAQKNDVCVLLGRLLDAMGNDKKLEAAPVNQLATAMGIIIDKFTANELNTRGLQASNNLFSAINDCAKEDGDDLPELQQAPEDGADVVE